MSDSVKLNTQNVALKRWSLLLVFQLMTMSLFSETCLNLTSDTKALLVNDRSNNTEIIEGNRLIYQDSFCIYLNGGALERYFIYPFEDRIMNFELFKMSDQNIWVKQDLATDLAVSFDTYALDLKANTTSNFKVVCELLVLKESVPLVIRQETSLLYKSNLGGIINGFLGGIYITFLLAIFLLCFVVKKKEFWFFVLYNYFGALLVVSELGFLNCLLSVDSFRTLPIIVVTIGTGQLISSVLCLYYYLNEDWFVKRRKYILFYILTLVTLNLILLLPQVYKGSWFVVLFEILSLNFLLVSVCSAIILLSFLFVKKERNLYFAFFAMFAHVVGAIIYLLSRFDEYYLEFAIQRRIDWVFLPDNYQFPLVYLFGIVIEIFLLSALVYKQYSLLVRRNYIIQDELLKTKSTQGLKILKGNEKEKMRLAKELHDSIGIKLSLLKINLMNQSENTVLGENEFNDAILNVEEAYKNIRSISRILSSPFIQQFGLVEYVKNELKKLQLVFGEGNVLYDIHEDEIYLSKDLEVIIYRLIAELLETKELRTLINRLAFYMLVHKEMFIIRLNYFVVSEINQFTSLLKKLTKNHNSVLQVLNGEMLINEFSGSNVELLIKLDPKIFNEFQDLDKSVFEGILDQSDGIFNV